MRSLAGSRVAAIAGRRGWPRFRRGATEVSACGGGYGRKGASRRLAAICGRSDHQIDGDLVIPPFQRCPRSRLDRGSSRNGGLPLRAVAKVGIKTIASRQQLRGSRPTSASDDPHTIVMMRFVYEIRVTLSTKKIDAFGSGRLAAASTICGQARQPGAPHRCFIPPPIPFPGHGGIRGIEIDGVLEIARL